MAYKDVDGLSIGSPAESTDNILQVDGPSVDLPDASYIRDAALQRDGMDLVLDGPNGTITVEGYFAQADAPNLVAPDGSTLTPELVNSFAKSPATFAQSMSMSDVSPVGSVDEVSGEATVTRLDGNVEPISLGTPIYQGDVIETSAEGAVNVAFIDETSFAVSEDARLAIDEYVFDPATEAGSQNFSVLKGVFVFTSGLIGRDDPDDVNIDTPSGSIGIRGTIIAGDVDAGEITVVEGAIVVRDFNGNELTLANQFETARFMQGGDGLEHMGELPANDVNVKFEGVAKVSPTLFSSINDAMQEQGGQPQNGPEQPVQNEAQDGPDVQQGAPQNDASGTVDENNDNQVDGTVDGEAAAPVDGEAQPVDGEAAGDAADADAANANGEAPAEGQAPAGQPAQQGMMGTDAMGANAGMGMNANGNANGAGAMNAQAVGNTVAMGEAKAGMNGKSSMMETKKAAYKQRMLDNQNENDQNTYNPNQNNNNGGEPSGGSGPLYLKSGNAPKPLHQYDEALDPLFKTATGQTWEYHFDKEFFPAQSGETITYKLTQSTIDLLNGSGDLMSAMGSGYVDINNNTLAGTSGQGWSFDEENGLLKVHVDNGVAANNSLHLEFFALDSSGNTSGVYHENLSIRYAATDPSGSDQDIDSNGNSISYTPSANNITVNIANSADADSNNIFLNDHDHTVTLGAGADAEFNNVYFGDGLNNSLVLYSGAENNLVVGGSGTEDVLVISARNKVYAGDGDDVFMMDLNNVKADLETMGDSAIHFDGGHADFKAAGELWNEDPTLAEAIPFAQEFLGDSEYGDTIQFTASAGASSLDFRIMDDDYFRSIERIDMRNSGNNMMLDLSYNDVIQMTDFKNTLIFRDDGGSTDVVNLWGAQFDAANGFNKIGDNVEIDDDYNGADSGADTYFDVYSNGTVTLLIEQDGTMGAAGNSFTINANGTALV